jgi:hypothetical protein
MKDPQVYKGSKGNPLRNYIRTNTDLRKDTGYKLVRNEWSELKKE